MNEPAELLMLTSLVRACVDCGDDRIFVVVEGTATDRGEYCCTYCGAAIVIDPDFGAPLPTRLAS